VQNQRKLNALDATLLVMGGIIGVGIFFTPSLAAERAYEPWAFLVLWAFGGLIAMCAAFTFAELGATFPRTGGWFVYLRESFGPLSAFLFAWVVLTVVSTGATAAVVKFCAESLHTAFPALVGGRGTTGHMVLAVLIVVGITAVALSGVKRAAIAQNVCMVVKLLALLALILCGLAYFSEDAPAADVAAAASGGGPEGSLVRGMLSALLPVFFAYGGWQMVGYIAPQVKDPERTLPRAIVFGVMGVIAVYLLANLAFVGILGIEGLAGNSGFASEIARAALGDAGERIVAAAMAVSALGWCVVSIVTAPWLYVAMAHEGLFFRRLGGLHPVRGVPTLALLVQMTITLVYVFAGNLKTLVDAVVFVEWIFHGLVALALVKLRFGRPELPRPYRSPLFPLAPAVYCLAALLVVGNTLAAGGVGFSVGSVELGLPVLGVGIVALGGVVHAVWRRVAPG
jgi:APA family basic amino acid/polyamine antiporter